MRNVEEIWKLWKMFILVIFWSEESYGKSDLLNRQQKLKNFRLVSNQNLKYSLNSAENIKNLLMSNEQWMKFLKHLLATSGP